MTMKFYFRSVARKSDRSIPVGRVGKFDHSINVRADLARWNWIIWSRAGNGSSPRIDGSPTETPRSQNFVIKSRAIVNCFRVFDRKQPHRRIEPLRSRCRRGASIPFPLAVLLNFLTFIRTRSCISIPGELLTSDSNGKYLASRRKRVDERTAVTLPPHGPLSPFQSNLIAAAYCSYLRRELSW